MNATLVITHGLPGSGKSTLAEKLKSLFGDEVVIAERDEIRSELMPADYHATGHTPEGEAIVEAMQRKIIIDGLAQGKLVVASDTNINPLRIAKLWLIGYQAGAKIVPIHFDITVEEAKKRNRVRAANGGRFVPEWCIDQMADEGYENGRLIRYSVSIQSERGKPSSIELAPDGPGGPSFSSQMIRILEAYQGFSLDEFIQWGHRQLGPEIV